MFVGLPCTALNLHYYPSSTVVVGLVASVTSSLGEEETEKPGCCMLQMCTVTSSLGEEEIGKPGCCTLQTCTVTSSLGEETGNQGVVCYRRVQ